MQQSTTTRGWTASQFELTKIQLLDAACDARGEDGGTLAPDRIVEVTGEPQLAADAASALVEEGLVHGEGRYGGGMPSIWISDAGSATVRARRERSSNRMQRAIACREPCWTGSTPVPAFLEDFAKDVRAHFEGDAFSEDEIRTAATDLKAKGLVQTMDVAEVGPIRMKINVDGKTVIENFDGSIKEYENRGQMQAGNHYTFTGNEVSGVIVAGTGNQVTQSNQTAHPELADLIRAIVDAARGTEIEDRISKLMAQLELEVDEDEPDETIVGKVLDRAEGVAAKAGVDIVVQLVMRAAKYIHDHGIAQLVGLG